MPSRGAGVWYTLLIPRPSASQEVGGTFRRLPGVSPYASDGLHRAAGEIARLALLRRYGGGDWIALVVPKRCP